MQIMNFPSDESLARRESAVSSGCMQLAVKASPE